MSSHLYSKLIVGKRVIIFIWFILESKDTVLDCVLTSVAFILCGTFKVIMGLKVMLLLLIRWRGEEISF